MIIKFVSYLLTCSFEKSGVQHILFFVFCFVLLRFLYPMLLVSLDCPLLIALRIYPNSVSLNEKKNITNKRYINEDVKRKAKTHL
jgi:hypothetical protein